MAQGRKELANFDSKSDIYKWPGKERRKHDDPNYKGPERRLERKRRKTIEQIIARLEKKLQ
jgi:hypothetical protein